MSTDPDRVDWTQVLAGRGDAFGRVFDRRYDLVRRQAARFLSTRVDLDDVVAVVFLELWRRRASVTLVEDSLAPWLIVATANVARHHRRSRARYDHLLAGLPPPEPDPGPDELAETRDVLTALRKLPLRDQRVLTLCVLEGYSERAAATALGVAPGTVKSRLHRAKRRLAHAVTDPAFTPTTKAARHDS